MRQLELVISFRGVEHNLGLLEPDCTIAKIKDVVLNITSSYGLDSASKILLNVTNPDNMVKVALDSDFGLQCLLRIHQALGVKHFKVKVAPVLCPQFQDSSLLQALLTNLGIVLPDEVISQLNDFVEENAFVGGAAAVGGQSGVREAIIEGQVTVGTNEFDEDVLLSDYSDKNNCSDDDVNADFMQAEINSVAEAAFVDEDSGGSAEATDEAEVDSDSEYNLSDANREGKRVVDSSDDDMQLGTIKLTNYIQQHEYKVGAGGKHRLKLGHVFRDVAHFREILHEVMIRKGFAIKTVYSEPRRFVGTCKEADCLWYVAGAKLNDGTGFILREYNKKHECRLTSKTVKVTSSWVAEKIKSHVIVDPNIKINLLKNYMQETYGLKIENMTLYRARAKARLKVFGDHSKGYNKLFDYAATIHKADPEAICKVLCDAVSIPDKVLFQRFFVSFPAQRNAFLNGCRPFIGVDGCHLKGKYGGVLLAAVSMDGNNGIVPLAMCVCEIENTETWGWFLEHLHSYLDDGRLVTFISDRQKGLVNSISNIWPTAYHRACSRHVYANFSKSHAGAQLKQLFWKATKSCNKHDFDEAMAEIKAVKKDAFEWIKKELHGYNWSMHTYDRNCMVDRTENNASECFNSWILPYRDRPCLTMLEEIRCRLMKLFTKRRNEAAAWKRQLAPKVLKELDKKNKIAQKMIVQASGDMNFQVMDRAYNPPRRFVVKLETRTCDFGYWEIAGLPCQHAMAAIGYARHEVEEYIPSWFTRHAYLDTYSVMFSPLSDQCTWERTGRPLIDPPIVQKKIGRPKKLRKRAENEPQKEKRKFFVICSFCGGSNHNMRSCPLRPSVARATRAKNNNSQSSTTPSQPLNASQQAIKKRKQILSGPSQSSNAGTRKRRAQTAPLDSGTRKSQSSQPLNQSQNPSQASNVTGSI